VAPNDVCPRGHTVPAPMASRHAPLNPDGAKEAPRHAPAPGEEPGIRPFRTHCRLGRGKLHRRTGRLDEARAELATAVAMLREMGMAFWLPEAEGELAEVSL
jgi:hypothetical protein